MSELGGKIVWVTGAGSGIGAAGAEALAEAGALVVLSGRREEKLKEVAGRIEAAGGAAEIEILDVTDRKAVAAVAGRIDKRHGRLDILVNSAGMNVPERHWGDLEESDWDDVVRINLDGTFYTSNVVLPIMRRQGGGLLIQIASRAGRQVNFLPGPAYIAAKHAVVAMSASLNIEEGRNGIRSCAICPGEVATPIMANRPVPPSEADMARMLQSRDLGRLIHYVATQPDHVCINEILLSPTVDRLGQPARKG
ncbi:SDR family oxidoreductase [Oceanibacterium hippocampi]|uniref:Putative oxidoreductase n=1 Tax=Oceanibacterium hippocampi TaxID=745714 RepID=A0A1Y5R8K8_9PROT|nr:SDR family NAD(P)-dependent oxidoreductase [Oceanibacterium hippocampi]SLN10566.1 putative oxidoreductase [Oceanibacterium hippocampi]